MSTWMTRGRPPTTYARGYVRRGGKPLGDFLGDAPQGHVVGGPAGQRERDHRHVVDFHRLDDPAADAGRNDVQVLVELLGELHQAPLAVLAHIVANGDDRLVLAAHRVDVLDAVDLIEDLFQGRGDQLLDFGRRMAGKIDVHVGQGDDDLRVLLARRQAQGRQADDRGQQNEDDRQVRFQKDLHDPVREVVFLACGRAGGLNHEGPPAAATARAGRPLLPRAARRGPPRHPRTCRPVRIARRLSAAVFHGLDQFQLTDAAHRPSRNDQHLFFLQGDEDAAEHAGIDARRARPGDFHLEGAAGGVGFGDDLADGAFAAVVEFLVLQSHVDVLADLEPVRQGLPHAGHQLHVFRIVEGDEDLGPG